ncbi:hypothetical protein E2C01_032093 [Portunus trituberculatus]|uniref:Uncharacterized protein n=1 Tax=Portunus trituberculatus TaxID=210409 RepID=A0A5B7F1W2_PORTR|nr:hypothetical protein [Portunus trituberculatus]
MAEGESKRPQSLGLQPCVWMFNYQWVAYQVRILSENTRLLILDRQLATKGCARASRELNIEQGPEMNGPQA